MAYASSVCFLQLASQCMKIHKNSLIHNWMSSLQLDAANITHPTNNMYCNIYQNVLQSFAKLMQVLVKHGGRQHFV